MLACLALHYLPFIWSGFIISCCRYDRLSTWFFTGRNILIHSFFLAIINVEPETGEGSRSLYTSAQFFLPEGGKSSVNTRVLGLYFSGK
ncbi:hypothetical protein PAXRUDRAFT_557038 [Paxillus rubicundulus Ve08.2h10]|uniref:Secreted protein n=1 Tax=Paxillus rubicundulus Ve08.2h10 TaxID=930991 RepID=A0A0D0E5F6_9AGAM|nr:hypothetical protein PAXRUDRAFT_557038 [Paxillus rubicundulus Ve08.2h10]